MLKLTKLRNKPNHWKEPIYPNIFKLRLPTNIEVLSSGWVYFLILLVFNTRPSPFLNSEVGNIELTAPKLQEGPLNIKICLLFVFNIINCYDIIYYNVYLCL